jgi:hypothetical protein
MMRKYAVEVNKKSADVLNPLGLGGFLWESLMVNDSAHQSSLLFEFCGQSRAK